MNSEEVSYGGGAVRVVSTLIKEGSYSSLLLIFEDSSFDRRRALSVVLGSDDEIEGACSPLDYHHQYILEISSPKKRYHTLNSAVAEIFAP